MDADHIGRFSLEDDAGRNGLLGVPAAWRRRASGETFESKVLGHLEFVRMPAGRRSFWLGRQHMPDSPIELQVVCEVDHEAQPGVDHCAAVVTIRRHQVRDAAACVPLINAQLRSMAQPATLQADDLCLAAIHLGPHPMIDPVYVLEYAAAWQGGELTASVSFERGVPRSARLAHAA